MQSMSKRGERGQKSNGRRDPRAHGDLEARARHLYMILPCCSRNIICRDVPHALSRWSHAMGINLKSASWGLARINEKNPIIAVRYQYKEETLSRF